MKPLINCCVLVLATTASNIFAADAPLDKPAVRQAVAKSIAWLEEDMQTWRNEHGCSACHHGPMYLWSIGAARRNGYDVNEPQLREFTRWLLTDDAARIFPRSPESVARSPGNENAADQMTTAMMGHKNLSQPTIYLTHAVSLLPDDEPLKKAGWQKIIDHLAAAQKEDGSFEGRNAWRPIFNTPHILTRFVVTGIREAGDQPTPDAVRARQQLLLKNADAFLSGQPADETHQGLVLRLLATPRRDDGESRDPGSTGLSTLVRRLVDLQRPDGGWSQTGDRDSDAFATGQTLTALHRAGVRSSHPAVRKAVDFLLRSQNADGTWPMSSRPNPETGKPAESLNPITYAATAWAVIGLTSHVRHDDR